jgi:hypothetical protein
MKDKGQILQKIFCVEKQMILSNELKTFGNYY